MDEYEFPEISKIPLDQMIRDERAQRDVDPAWIGWLTENFQPKLVGLLSVTERPDGTYSVNDGWHRRCAAMNRGYADWWAMVRAPSPIQEEAELFTGLNHRRGVRYIDNFFARVTAGELVAAAIEAEIAQAGWRIGKATADGHLNAVQALERVYRLRDDAEESRMLVRLTLRVVTEAWGYTSAAVSGSILAGIGKVLVRYEDVLLDGLIRALASYPGGPVGLVANARSLRETFRSTVPNCVAEIAVTAYNVRRTSRRLPDWRSR